jgi:hypothetical protein
MTREYSREELVEAVREANSPPPSTGSMVATVLAVANLGILLAGGVTGFNSLQSGVSYNTKALSEVKESIEFLEKNSIEESAALREHDRIESRLDRVEQRIAELEKD